jgi:hypothetical protein
MMLVEHAYSLPGVALANLIETLCYKPDGRWFDSNEVIGFFNLPNPYSRSMTLGSSQPLTEIITMNDPGDKGRPERKADNLTSMCESTV